MATNVFEQFDKAVQFLKGLRTMCAATVVAPKGATKKLDLAKVKKIPPQQLEISKIAECLKVTREAIKIEGNAKLSMALTPINSMIDGVTNLKQHQTEPAANLIPIIDAIMKLVPEVMRIR